MPIIENHMKKKWKVKLGLYGGYRRSLHTNNTCIGPGPADCKYFLHWAILIPRDLVIDSVNLARESACENRYTQAWERSFQENMPGQSCVLGTT